MEEPAPGGAKGDEGPLAAWTLLPPELLENLALWLTCEELHWLALTRRENARLLAHQLLLYHEVEATLGLESRAFVSFLRGASLSRGLLGQFLPQSRRWSHRSILPLKTFNAQLRQECPEATEGWFMFLCVDHDTTQGQLSVKLLARYKETRQVAAAAGRAQGSVPPEVVLEAVRPLATLSGEDAKLEYIGRQVRAFCRYSTLRWLPGRLALLRGARGRQSWQLAAYRDPEAAADETEHYWRSASPAHPRLLRGAYRLAAAAVSGAEPAQSVPAIFSGIN